MRSLLVTRRVDVLAKDAKGRTVLHWSAWGRSKDVWDVLGDALVPSDYDTQDSEGRTAMHYAAMRDASETVERLHQKGMSLGAHDSQGRTPLHYAARQGTTV